MTGVRADNTVPAARRASGIRGQRNGLLGHVAVRSRSGGRLVREPRRLPESLPAEAVTAFVADLDTHRDRAIVLAMVLGGLRAADAFAASGRRRHGDATGAGRRQGRQGTGGADRRRVLHRVRRLSPWGAAGRRDVADPECFVVLHGPTRGRAMTEAGLRKVFRTHRVRSGATRVQPHRLRHTYGTELAAAGIDLLALRELMGHASPETTARIRAPVVGHAGRRVRRCPQGDGPMRTAAATSSAAPDLLAAFTAHNSLLGGQAAYRRLRLAAAQAFCDAHPDLDVWMSTPVDARLVELHRRQFAWQLVSLHNSVGTVPGRFRFPVRQELRAQLAPLGQHAVSRRRGTPP